MMLLGAVVRRWRSSFTQHAAAAAHQHSSPHLGFSIFPLPLGSRSGETDEWSFGHRTLTTQIRVSENGDVKYAEKSKLQKINGVIRQRKWDAETGKQLERLKFKLTPALVCEVVTKQKDLNLARAFFGWAGQQEGYTHSIGTYTLMIKRLAGSQESESVNRLLYSMWKDGHTITSHLITSLLRTYSRGSNISGALELFNQMQTFGCTPSINMTNLVLELLLKSGFNHSALIVFSKLRVPPDAQTFRILVHGFFRTGKLSLALEPVHKMIESGVNPGVQSFTMLIDGLSKAGDIEQAVKVFKAMKAVPNVVTYTTLVNGLAKAGRLEEACEIFIEMKEKGCSPDAIAYNTLIDGLGKAGEADMACGLFKEMKDKGLVPNLCTYNIMIAVLGKAGRQTEAWQLFHDMKGQGAIPDVFTYNTLIDVLGKGGDMDKVLTLIKEMVESASDAGPSQGFKSLSVMTYNTLMSAFMHNGHVDEAVKLLDVMRKHECAPSVITYTTLIDGLGKAGKLDEAVNLLREMETQGCEPNVFTYGSLMASFVRSSQLAMALSFYDEMLSKGCLPDVATYCLVISSYCKSHDTEKAMETFRRVEEPSLGVYKSLLDGLVREEKIELALEVFNELEGSTTLVPDTFVYNVMVNGFVKANRVDEACKLVDSMKARNITPDLITYSSLLDGLGKAGRLEEAFSVFTKMSEEGCEPDVVAYTSLMDVLGKGGKIDHALTIFRTMTKKKVAPDAITYRALNDALEKVGRSKDAQKIKRLRFLANQEKKVG